MNIIETGFKGLIVLEPVIYEDDRGLFFETYRDYVLDRALGYPVKFVQENQSISYRNVFRGFHFQYGAYAQSKLVRVVSGSVLDIVVDLRPEERSYGNVHMEILNDENRKQMFVPKGFGHGFLTLSPHAIFQYKCDNYYSKEYEGGINPHDPELRIANNLHTVVHDLKWDKMILNKRDKTWPTLKQYTDAFPKLNELYGQKESNA